MGFTPGFLDELRLRSGLVETVGRRVKLQRRGREHVGLCPFHSEKSPSFTVVEDKGFYHCFGCGAHGDVITFVQETEGLGFREAVERLAHAAGLDLPRSDPQAQAMEARRLTLVDVNEAAASWFKEQLHSSRGQGARTYLERRDVKPSTCDEFLLGFAPQGRGLMKQALLAKGFDETLLIEAGLLVVADDEDQAKESFDRFRNRLMFPIRDRRGRVIAFGGRALDDAPAKYINSPETPLFHKGTTLYNLDQAYPAARDTGAIIVAEGYMDVIALVQAGIRHVVAPLGTALTEDQLKLLWRMAAEPVLCFDGDEAGSRAAWRASERALPLLSPGQSLRFALLPKGEDPDSLIQNRGLAVMEGLLNAAAPLAEVIWRQATQGAQIDTPERRAGLEKRLFVTLKDIKHPQLRGHYERDFRARLTTLFGSNFNRNQSFDRFSKPRLVTGASSYLKASAGVKTPANAAALGLERLILAILIVQPILLTERLEELAVLHFSDAKVDKAIRSLITLASDEGDLDSHAVRDNLQSIGLSSFLGELERSHKGNTLTLVGGDYAKAQAGLTHALGRLRRLVDLERERAEAEAELAKTGSPEAWERFKAVQAALAEPVGMEVDFDASTPNGM